ncbi:PREDICTED: uncharacterized protein LOC105954345 [Erythranthe guttata]|uniref:uncharacterized protein LOC105954345 n=1 Tax=Erythranthe guttata TaxID=4155 RepID=UPI00064DA390|nr:PREDICTED: uncharacterized protein LOC105954345 [Erythranthe guttata]|eukprot:XP_012833475.1 PREDICTED: uncharacterized protein LOC105954345 [Erythranthe guttata]
MEFPLISQSNILKKIILLISLLSTVTANAENGDIDLFSEACRRTENTELCFSLLKHDNRTSKATTLHDIGVGTLSMAIEQSNLSVKLLRNSLGKKSLAAKDRPPYVKCRQCYTTALAKLSKAQTQFRDNKFPFARKNVENAKSAANACEGLRSPPPGLKTAIEASKIMLSATYILMQG